jgi:alkanesulfonate monooxygenase SsuD/methylene tetrahydromethanopterin reductase-like flavin-dependent oxidoreductase (luciferase family)
MQFGVFDHVDDSGLPHAQHYEMRLRLVEAIDRLAFYSYHVAEHHGTPLGLAPSPSVYLAAVAQRTRRVRFGPLVYVAALYHPIRLAEEICMLDHLSQGRLQLGIGRGAVWLEQELYGIAPDSVPKRYEEVRAILLQALSSERVNFSGEYFEIRDFPVQSHPLQQPRPPLWYGIGNPDSAVWAAENDVNVVSLQPAQVAARSLDRYREEWTRLAKPLATLPHLGLARHVVVGATDAEAREIARAAYPRWRESFSQLWDSRKVPFPLGASFPRHWDGFEARGQGIAGAPATVRDFLRHAAGEAHANFLLCQMMFGSMRYESALRSLELFSSDVIPAF